MKRTHPILATLLGIVLVGIAAAIAGLVITSGVLWSDTPSASNSAVGLTPADNPVAAAPVGQPVAIAGAFQNQPRDPFRPLIPDETTSSTTSTTVGDGSTTSTTVDGSTTSTTEDFDPDTYRVLLAEIRETAGVLRATVLVNGTSYNVGVGESFAGGLFKLISLTETKGVFTFGDKAFELTVGQEILK